MGIGRGDQHTNIVSRGNIDDIWKWIIDILGYFVQGGTIINDNGR